MQARGWIWLVCVALATACDSSSDDDMTSDRDGGRRVARDAGVDEGADGGDPDAGEPDAGDPDRDAGPFDASPPRDAGPARDAGPRDAAVLSSFIADEFDAPGDLTQWTRLHVEQGVPARHSRLEVLDGHLLVEPTAHNGWFEDDKGPFLFQMVTGDFVARTYVRAVNRNNPVVPPTAQYNSTGFVARDPASVVGGQENWVMYNVGYQETFTGSEGKTTVSSGSTLFIIQGAAAGELVLCRRGDTFRMLRRLEGEDTLTETNVFERPDLPATLQLGVVANGYTATPNLRAEFDWVRIARPQSDADCRADIAP